MKAVAPLPPPPPQSRRSPTATLLGCGELAVRHLNTPEPSPALGRMQPPPDCGAGPGEEPPALCLLQHDMEGCYSRLRRLVPSIPQHRRVSRVEILQHVIDYILDLQLALDTHPALRPPAPTRTPLADLNTDPAASVVNKQGDSILCR
ncbi:DNA-binding protein inhibitor ID-4 [Pleurodeles waltl]|uniref:DNA-binding protein inhibitor ID-4 n=1 Tax=Pleurodeles waltl TaxID=8319 RepID=UPI003709653C